MYDTVSEGFLWRSFFDLPTGLWEIFEFELPILGKTAWTLPIWGLEAKTNEPSSRFCFDFTPFLLVILLLPPFVSFVLCSRVLK